APSLHPVQTCLGVDVSKLAAVLALHGNSSAGCTHVSVQDVSHTLVTRSSYQCREAAYTMAIYARRVQTYTHTNTHTHTHTHTHTQITTSHTHTHDIATQ